MVEPGQLQMFNKPDPNEHFFVLPNDVPFPVEYEADAKIDNAGTYTFWLEDHTLGNALRMQLLRNQHVLFASYRIPHPLTNNMELRVQTTENSTPMEAMKIAHEELICEVKSLLEQFQHDMVERGIFPENREIQDKNKDETGSNRFSEDSETEVFQKIEEGPLQHLQDDNPSTWLSGYHEMEEKLKNYTDDSTRPIQFEDNLAALDDDTEDVEGSLPIADQNGMALALYAHEEPPEPPAESFSEMPEDIYPSSMISSAEAARLAGTNAQANSSNQQPGSSNISARPGTIPSSSLPPAVSSLDQDAASSEIVAPSSDYVAPSTNDVPQSPRSNNQ